MLFRNYIFPILMSNAFRPVPKPISKTLISDFTHCFNPASIKKAGLKIGIMAINVEPKGLIIESNYKGLVFKNALQSAIDMSTFLKKEKKCEVIICLSHLGADTTKNEINDFEIAHKTRYIDVIIGGHSHSMITNNTVKNVAGKPIVIAQMAKSGLYLGKVELELEKKK